MKFNRSVLFCKQIIVVLLLFFSTEVQLKSSPLLELRDERRLILQESLNVTSSAIENDLKDAKADELIGRLRTYYLSEKPKLIEKDFSLFKPSTFGTQIEKIVADPQYLILEHLSIKLEQVAKEAFEKDNLEGDVYFLAASSVYKLQKKPRGEAELFWVRGEVLELKLNNVGAALECYEKSVFLHKQLDTAEAELKQLAHTLSLSIFVAETAGYYDQNAKAKQFYYETDLVFANLKKHLQLNKERMTATQIKNALNNAEGKMVQLYLTATDLYRRQGEYLEAENYLNKANELVKSASEQTLLHVRRADLEREKGNFAAARKNLYSALNKIKQINLENQQLNREFSAIINKTLNTTIGISENKIVEATAVSYEIQDNDKKTLELTINLLNLLGHLRMESREIGLAQSHFQQALKLQEILDPNDVDKGVFFQNLAITYLKQQNFEKAKLYLKNAQIIAEQNPGSGGSNDILLAVRGIFATVSIKEGQPIVALEQITKNLKLLERLNGDKTGAVSPVRQAETNWHYGEVLFALGRYGEAVATAEKSLKAAQEKGWTNLIYLSATLLGRSLERLGEDLKARRAFELAISEIEKTRHAVGSDYFVKLSYLSDADKSMPYLLLLKQILNDGRQSATGSDSESTNADRIAFHLAEKLKARVLQDKYALESNSVTGSQQQQSETFPQTQLSEFSLKQLEKSALPKLENDQAIIEFVLSEDETIIFLLTNNQNSVEASNRTRLRVFRFPWGRDVVGKAIKDWRLRIANLNYEHLELGKNVAKLVFPDAVRQLLDKETELLIVPDGEIWELPLAALPLDEDAYFISKFSYKFLPTSSNLIDQTFGKTAQRPLDVLLIEPDKLLNEKPIAGFEALPPVSAKLSNAWKQIDGVKQVKLLKSQQFDNLPASYVWHFRTHAQAEQKSGLNSGLAFVDEKHSFRLTTASVSQSKIKAHVVVFEACETALGEPFAGEGMIGLWWAALMGGAKKVVATQWSVSATETDDLMADFYLSLKKNKTNLAYSLRQAQLNALKNPETLHPFFWAGIVLVEVWTPN